LYQGGSKDSPSNSSSKDFIEVPEPPISTIINDTPFQKSVDKHDDSTNSTRRTSKKRVKMADLRTLIETKILSKSDRGLEKCGSEAANGNGNGNGKKLQHTVRVD
jgi:protein unc-80